MKIRKARKAPAHEPPAKDPAEPPWAAHLDPMERPNREDLSADRSAFDSMLTPVPLPRWLRGRRRSRDKIN